MKKITKTLLMLTCVFGLTACGAEEASELQEIREYSAIDKAEQIVDFTTELIEADSISYMLYSEDEIADSIIGELQTADTVDELLSSYSNVELGDLYALAYSQYSGDYSFACEGKAVRGALTSFQSGYESMGSIWADEPEAVVDGDTIIVTVPVTGDEDASGSVELIFTNDIYLKMTSCTLNLDETKGELMIRAALNTLLGMGTVFVVLILISFIISAFEMIPKIQASFTSQKKAPEPAPKAAPAPAPVVEEEEELSDDMELVAVIAAAIAAYEGAASVEGFQVRSIKRANTNKWKKG